LSVEMNVLDQAQDRVNLTIKSKHPGLAGKCLVTCQSTTDLRQMSNSIDYIFTDPPFGGNLMYSELNFIWESWLRVFGNNKEEAIENKTQKKTLSDYQAIMTRCFGEYHRILKPGRWMTVEFHNSRNSVWIAIQEAIQHAGFVVADVRTLDRQQGSFNQVTASGAVKQDLIISAYKPDQSLETRFQLTAGTQDAAWSFVHDHVKHLPVFVSVAGKAEILSERQKYLLFDRMVAFHVQRGVAVPMSASEFYEGLQQRFPERDGMYFLTEQVSEYDQKRLSIKELQQLELFVNDEKSSIQWVRQQLSETPMTYQQLQPKYMQKAQRTWGDHEQPIELQVILDQGFVKDSQGRWSIPDPRNEAHLEQLRNRALLKEFQQYQDIRGKLKVVRTEALRAGFKDCWQKGEYTTIIQMAKRVPEAVIQEDPALLMYYDNALMRKGE